MFQKVLIVLSTLISLSNGDPYVSPQTLPDRQVMVHLFEWKWTDVADECENYLSKHKFGAVQISPPNEHLIQDYEDSGQVFQPWWIRYQPVSYKLTSRSGTEQELADMIVRCNKVGVRVIVDAVINHMTKVDQKYPGQTGISSSGGSYFDGTDGIETYPGVPFSNLDFHDPECHGNIHGDYYQNNPSGVRLCRLADCTDDSCPGLLDLNHGKEYVQQKIADYFNRLIDLGVAGFRIDAVKHMFPGDMVAILNKVKNLNASIFGSNQRPFIVQEVIDKGGESIKDTEYLQSGRVTNFKYGVDVANAVKKNNQNFQNFYKYGGGWSEYLPDLYSLDFIDNHDTQRYEPVLTYKDGQKYSMAITYMLAWSYGYTRVMSSYYFSNHHQGPPTTGAPNWSYISPKFQADGKCAPESGWVCEHRWAEIRRMVEFRSVTIGAAPANLVTEDHRIAFRRGRKGFFALNNADGEWNRNFYVELPAGTYCDIISGEYDEKSSICSGSSIKVDSNGRADIRISSGKTLAIHIDQRSPPTPPQPSPPLPSTYKRTVVMIKRPTNPGENVFIRGGLVRDDCANVRENCAIPIAHRTNVSDHILTYLGWSQEDETLDWEGASENQGTYDGVVADGTPLTYTTNDPTNENYHPLNKYGPGYWLVDLMMDCSKTSNGWFSLKNILKPRIYDDQFNWEIDINQSAQCKGNSGGVTPGNIGKNHAGQCGMINIFSDGTGDCEINRFE